jgi:hypothetical protein
MRCSRVIGTRTDPVVGLVHCATDTRRWHGRMTRQVMGGSTASSQPNQSPAMRDPRPTFRSRSK